ncbi:hypothetical protein ACSVDE_18630 [Pseudalkalibacillus sp. Hm43]|uniref:hypothetical protein n=1 Tax=Pseudalkalibacillus sp. Hm43 TaxID=3450742 RepID=UPI003F4370E5
MDLSCFGDSHVLVFQYIKDHQFLKKTNISICHVGGATALGMVNPNSKTNALQTFNLSIHPLPRNRTLLFMLGEVDCGFVIWYRAQKYNLSVSSQLNETLTNYFSFLKSIQSLGFQHIVVATPPPPTIKDHQSWGDVANLRKGISATQKQRTELTQQYNQILRKYCKNNSLKLLDTEQDFIDGATGLVDCKYLNKDPLDHHLDLAASAAVYVRKLNELGIV